MTTINRVSACTFIKDTFTGAFCLFESMASLLPYVDDMHILDLGSEDGTLNALERISKKNPRVHVHRGEFSCVDAAAFADAANDCIQLATHKTVLFWQADEIWHPNLLTMMDDKLKAGATDLAFWRYQLRDNFQVMKWFPHPVHRLGPKESFNFVNDGMNSDRVYGVDICSSYDMGYFTKWGEMNPLELPLDEMIMDVSLVGGFRDNIEMRRKLHAPMWHESDDIEGIPSAEWIRNAKNNDDWTKSDSPFNIPHIMKRHVGRTIYILDWDLLIALENDNTLEVVHEIHTKEIESVDC